MSVSPGVTLSPDREALVELSAALAARDAARLETALRTAAAETDAEAVEETILQSYLFLGYPVALNALGLWRTVSGCEAAEPAEDREEWEERGARVCQAVYGGQYEGLRANIGRLHRDMERWMVEEGYGKVLGRPGLDLPTRELCIAAILMVQDVPRQLYSHLRGALNVGASAAEVERALEIAVPWCTADVANRARETWASVRARTSPRSS
ncbi:MAG: carboxymuconolactone decarboxylase family protein [Gemmatimonadetes bacterium]|nr:carboxymuconolactone decarboxylase family protein [Gemmatimonadota bacterium]